MTILYSQSTGEPVANVSHTTADLAIARSPGLYFYIDEEPQASVDEVLAEFGGLSSLFAIGGTDYE